MPKFWRSAEFWDWIWLAILVMWAMTLPTAVLTGDWGRAVVAACWVLSASAKIMDRRVNRASIGLQPRGYLTHNVDQPDEEWIAFRVVRRGDG